MQKSKYLLLILIWANCAILNAQKKSNVELKITAKVYSNAVLLRWQTSNLNMFKAMSKSGFTLTRTTVSRDTVALPNEEVTNFVPSGIVASENKLSSISKKESEIIKSILFEEEESLHPLESLKFNNDMHLFSSVILASNFELALASGMGWSDLTAKNNEAYLYKISGLYEGKTYTASVYVDLSNPAVQLLPPKPKAGENQTGYSTIKWDAEMMASAFWGFNLYRANVTDGVFKKINKAPIVNAQNTANPMREIVFPDSIGQTEEIFVYKITGIDLFGMESGFSDTCIQAGSNLFILSPEIENIKYGKNNSELFWTYDEKRNAQILGFNLYYSDSLNGEKTKINDKLILNSNRNYQIEHTIKSGYITLSSVSLTGKESFSSNYLFQPVDSIAPLSPLQVRVETDTLGHVKLSWNKNKERDFAYYRVYRADARNNEFSVLSMKYFEDSFFTDSLNLEMLRDSIYYKVAALDSRFNEDQNPRITAVAVPNLLAPSRPSIANYYTKEGKIFLKVQLPAYNRKMKVVGVRKMVNNLATSEFVNASANSLDSLWIADSAVISDQTYEYSFYCVAENGKKSERAYPIRIYAPKNEKMPPVSGVFVFKDTVSKMIQVTWNYHYNKEVKHYRIYSKNKAGKWETVKTTLSNEQTIQYYTRDVKMETEIKVVAYFKDGRISL